MNNYPKRRKKNPADSFVKWIYILSAVLVILVLVAILTKPESKPGKETLGSSTQGTEQEPTGSTAGSTAGTTEATSGTEEPSVNDFPLLPIPEYGEYEDVGSGYIVEILTSSAETFNGATTDDNSSPVHNYLPKGTVDYCSREIIYNSYQSYMQMRCGRRVYIQKRNYPASQKSQVTKCYEGTLPDHNEIGIASLKVSGHHTILTLDTLWKAPFYFHLEPQEFVDLEERDYQVTEVTAEYVDITFCYATSFTGSLKIPADNPLFIYADLYQTEKDCTLRLYLKKTGGFYGWDAYYNEQDQLCFRFLNPVKATASGANRYGADMTGIRILLDVGHGGYDGGSEATNAAGVKVDEAELNLKLAKIVAQKLESMGATVILNRTNDSELTVDQRINSLKDQAPDICIAIHQNSIPDAPNFSGADICYFTPFSQPLAKLLHQKTLDTGVYRNTRLDSNLYYVARETPCPVVLMENGCMTNATDLAGMENDAVLQKKADAMAQAVAAYFLAIE